MKRSIMFLLLTLILAAYAALFLATWSATVAKTQGSGGAEASTSVSVSTISEKEQKESGTETSEILFPIRGNYWKTSDFGIRTSPFTGQTAVHYGTDYGAPEGAKIQAVKSGIVVTHWPAPDGYYKGHPTYGGFVEILHNDGLSRSAHMSKTFVREGDRVEAGQVIGIIGNTGMTSGKTGRHLHFEYVMNSEILYERD